MVLKNPHFPYILFHFYRSPFQFSWLFSCLYVVEECETKQHFSPPPHPSISPLYYPPTACFLMNCFHWYAPTGPDAISYYILKQQECETEQHFSPLSPLYYLPPVFQWTVFVGTHQLALMQSVIIYWNSYHHPANFARWLPLHWSLRRLNSRVM